MVLLAEAAERAGADVIFSACSSLGPTLDAARKAVDVPIVKDYRAAMEKYRPAVPAGIGDGSYQPPALLSYGSLEGYVSARAFLVILERAGKRLDRKTFYAAAEALGKVDLGIGAEAEFSKTRHQLLDKVWFTYSTAEGWRLTDDPASTVK